MTRDGKDGVVILFDVDNTLLDNDGVVADLMGFLTREIGPERQARYWTLFEALRTELGYADYLGALQRYRVEFPRDPSVLCLSEYLVDYPFATRLYPHALDVIERANAWGTPVILSDGDAVFQPRKITRSGLGSAVNGAVLIYIHKEAELPDVAQRYPARRYIMVDDKLRILTAVKAEWGQRVTTVFPRQGHYARDPDVLKRYPPADVTVEQIGELIHFDLESLLAAARPSETRSAHA